MLLLEPAEPELQLGLLPEAVAGLQSVLVPVESELQLETELPSALVPVLYFQSLPKPVLYSDL